MLKARPKQSKKKKNEKKRDIKKQTQKNYLQLVIQRLKRKPLVVAKALALVRDAKKHTQSKQKQNGTYITNQSNYI